MKALQLVALFALSAVAAPQSPNVPDADESHVVSVDGVEVEGNIIIKPIFDILSYRNGRVGALSGEARDSDRSAETGPPVTVSAVEASEAKIPGLEEYGLFYRADPRPYSEIFQSGFTPQGNDMSLQHHLSFAGNSGFVSVSRSPSAAGTSALGRTDAKVEKIYIYAIAPEGMPDGYWVPGIFPPQRNPAVRRKLEFVVAGPVAGQNIAFAYEVSRGNPAATGNKIMNEYYHAKSLPACSGRKRTLCDPAKAVAGAGPNETKGNKRQGGSRVEPGRSRRRTTTTFRFRSNVGPGLSLFFQKLTPYAHDALDYVKKCDSAICHSLAWFDNSIKNVQRWIGGERVPETGMNELQLKIICWLRGEDAYPNSVGDACLRLKAKQDRPKRGAADLRIEGLNQVLRACEAAKDTASMSDEAQFEMLQRCDAFRNRAAELDLLVTEAAARAGEGIKAVVAGNGGSVPASAAAENGTATVEAMEVMGLYGELFEDDLALSGSEPCWSAAGLQSSKPPGWELVSSALVYYDENGAAKGSCRACEKEDKWALRCSS
ncbi:hypothetical protein LLEC1_06554, partial [Akanthomyces lecanii]